MSQTIARSLALLDELCRSTGKSQPRRTELFFDPETTQAPAWAFHLPRTFWPALDLAKTEVIIAQPTGAVSQQCWTQGSNFAFQTGDIIYDTPTAYSSSWADALRTINRCLRITSALPARGECREKLSDNPPVYTYFPRYCGEVSFEILVPDTAKSRLIVTERHKQTQDEFVRFVISGSQQSSVAPQFIVSSELNASSVTVPAT